MTIPYSSPQVPSLGQLKDINLDNTQNGDNLQYDSTTRTWNNVAPQVPSLGQLNDVNLDNTQNGDNLQYDSTTGTWNNVAPDPSLILTGYDDSVVFKNGPYGLEAGRLITRDPTALNYVMTLEGTNKLVGINKAFPTVTLDVGGRCLFDNTVDVCGNEIGNVFAQNLKLFSHNIRDNAFTINSNKDLAFIGGFRTKKPDLPDTVLPGDDESFYKVYLQNGLNLWTGAPFDTQNPFASGLLGFPTGQMVEYQNKMPITGARLYGKDRAPQSLARTQISAGATEVICTFGLISAGTDAMYYDPTNMRSRRPTGGYWHYFGAPERYRNNQHQLIFTIDIHLQLSWAGSTNNSTFLVVSLEQYRNGSLLRTVELHHTTDRMSSDITSARKTIFGYLTTAGGGSGEDFDSTTDDYRIVATNQAGGGQVCTVETATFGVECILAQ